MKTSHPSPVTRRVLLAAALALGLAPAVHAERVIRIVVPFGAGATQDTVARTFSNELGQALGATVVVENRAGAGGSVGTAQVAKSAPDGNTLVLAAASHNLAGPTPVKDHAQPVRPSLQYELKGTAVFVPCKKACCLLLLLLRGQGIRRQLRGGRRRLLRGQTAQCAW